MALEPFDDKLTIRTYFFAFAFVWNLQLDTLGDVKTTGKYWGDFVFLSRNNDKTVLLPETVHQTSLGESLVSPAAVHLPTLRFHVTKMIKHTEIKQSTFPTRDVPPTHNLEITLKQNTRRTAESHK